MFTLMRQKTETKGVLWLISYGDRLLLAIFFVQTSLISCLYKGQSDKHVRQVVYTLLKC